jgi:hypothetical protein
MALEAKAEALQSAELHQGGPVAGRADGRRRAKRNWRATALLRIQEQLTSWVERATVPKPSSKGQLRKNPNQGSKARGFPRTDRAHTGRS